MHAGITFNQKYWPKSYTDMSTELRKKAKINFEKYFFKLMYNAVFEKTMENLRKHRDIKLVTTKARRNYLVSAPNYYITIFFQQTFIAKEMKKKKEKKTFVSNPV